ncbi:TIGR00153 family protein [Vallitalea okinawensis]|uniref:TIGR00153 family protein n=1 Tax=Vallitalea okinawensis TaxID=2078660 RepID=UPI000CFC882F|nr:TIGR00153 family protein [Vallitalea okinawensis]
MFFSKNKGENVHDLVQKHVDSVQECLETFQKFLDIVVDEGITDEAKKLGEKVEELESTADANRHQIIQSLLNGALLPDTRREILKLIEFIDEIANQCEEVVKQILLQKIYFPKPLKTNIHNINTKTCEQFNLLEEVVRNLFIKMNDDKGNFTILKDIEKLESEVDDYEYEAIKVLFEDNVSLAEKNQLRSIISKIADISDVIEDISDIIEIVLAIRRA